MAKIKPLSGRGKEIVYSYNKDIIEIEWSNIILNLHRRVIDDIINNFFVDKDNWYLLGACEDNPSKNGLGEYIKNKHKLTPRYTSVIATIMFNEGQIQYRGLKPIELKKL